MCGELGGQEEVEHRQRSPIDSFHPGRFVYYEGVRRKLSEQLEDLRARL